MTADRYAPDVDQQVENDQAALQAVQAVALSYLQETNGRHLSRVQRDQQDRAERLARWLSRQDAKRGHP